MRSEFWPALIISLPTRNATARMRVWRALKGLGCGVLRDGVYMLPGRDGARQSLVEQAEEVTRAGGSAHLIEVAVDRRQQSAFRALFDRSAEYAALIKAMRSLKSSLDRVAPRVLTREVAKLKREFDSIARIDFFPGAAQEQAGAQLAGLETVVNRLLAPDEPHAAARAVKRLDRAAYRNRTWATRARPWVDRLASAWLIKRFIDPQAKFVWIDQPRNCPKRALGFDFDGATFTHVGGHVTYEVLAASFGLDDDAALIRIGETVHYLDVGGIPSSDAGGVETVLRGAVARCASDDRLLAAGCRIFDLLYASYSQSKAQ